MRKVPYFALAVSCALLGQLSLVAAQSQVCSVWVSVYTHTFVMHSPRRDDPSWGSGCATWDSCGFECATKANSSDPTPQGCVGSGPGGLRRETYDCDNPKWSAVSVKCGRDALHLLANKYGWTSAPYKGTTGAIGCTGRRDPNSSCSPSSSGNVCWHFTCGWWYCALNSISGCQGGNFANFSVPSEWKCPVENYGSGDGCHCGCGVWDPDCNDRTAETLGCKGTDMCLFPGDVCKARSLVLPVRKKINTAEGVSVYSAEFVPDFALYPANPVAPSGWTCPAHYYNTDDGCDDQCGLPDPDCLRTPTFPQRYTV